MTGAPGRVRLRGYRREARRPGALAGCTLVVPTYHRAREILRLLDRLETLPDVPAEVIVVDGSTGEETAEAVAGWVRERDLRFDVGLARSPAGLTRQRNAGVDISAGDHVFFLDDDCLPLPGYFQALRNVLAAPEHRDVGAVCGAILNELNQPLSWRWRIRIALGLVPKGGPGEYLPTAASLPRSLESPFSGVRAVDVLPGGASAYRREVFSRHRFSEFFEGYAQGEDLEMSRRIARDFRLLACGDAHVVHDHTPAGRPAFFAKGRMEVRNRFFIRQRHSGDARWRDRARFWLDIAYVFAWDLVYLVARRPPGGHLKHAAGVAAGAVSCLLDPPRYDEPGPARAFDVAWEPMPAAAVGQREAS